MHGTAKLKGPYLQGAYEPMEEDMDQRSHHVSYGGGQFLEEAGGQMTRWGVSENS